MMTITQGHDDSDDVGDDSLSTGIDAVAPTTEGTGTDATNPTDATTSGMCPQADTSPDSFCGGSGNTYHCRAHALRRCPRRSRGHLHMAKAAGGPEHQ